MLHYAFLVSCKTFPAFKWLFVPSKTFLVIPAIISCKTLPAFKFCCFCATETQDAILIGLFTLSAAPLSTRPGSRSNTTILMLEVHILVISSKHKSSRVMINLKVQILSVLPFDTSEQSKWCIYLRVEGDVHYAQKWPKNEEL